MRRLIVCCDGTWNFPEQSDRNIEVPTNVVKTARAILPIGKDGTSQLLYYHSGVGSGSSNKILGGVTGMGLSQIIMELYGFLVDNYIVGDKIYLLGFSRGAYAVRSLAGLIRNCGILQKAHADQIGEAYGMYRNKDDACRPDGPVAKAFVTKYSRRAKIDFIGVWDTVGSLGVPDPALQFMVADVVNFHDTSLSGIVEAAYHALALDERRRAFPPCLWIKQSDAPPAQVIEQVWFTGVHCNVGGGYTDCGLSDLALTWMLTKARRHGLEFDDNYLASNVFPNHSGVLRNSKSGFYKVFPDALRVLGANGSSQSIHQSVLDRRTKVNVYNPEQLLGYPGSPDLVSVD